MSTLAALAAAALAMSALAAAPVPRGGHDDLVGSALAAFTDPPGDRLDNALGDDRSLLSFLPPEVTSGRYELRLLHRHDPRPAPRWSGVFWRTASGNAYTRAGRYDVALVRREVRALVERLQAEWRRTVDRARARGEPISESDERSMANFAPLLSGEFYDGAEHQLTLDDLVAPYLGVPGVGMLAIDASHPCKGALDRHRAAVRAAVGRVEPAFTPGKDGRDRWRLDLVALHVATATTRDAAAEACHANAEAMGPSRIRRGAAALVTRWARGIVIDIDNGGEVAFKDRVPMVIDVTPGDVGPPPLAPRPFAGSALVKDFLLAVGACGDVPWEYSNFMAGDSYTSPADIEDYYGPNLFASEWVCERDVPAHDRRRQQEELARR